MAVQGIDQRRSPVLSTPRLMNVFPRDTHPPSSLEEPERTPRGDGLTKRRLEAGSAMNRYGYSDISDWSKVRIAGLSWSISWRSPGESTGYRRRDAHPSLLLSPYRRRGSRWRWRRRASKERSGSPANGGLSPDLLTVGLPGGQSIDPGNDEGTGNDLIENRTHRDVESLDNITRGC
ncbi:hypothetical protein LZ32DRAFT_427026 [Colletotrichum eremochloae]|nr:hypothetical protein LZ32DRAFT_427026 [Colletotrichum eremochloae]